MTTTMINNLVLKHITEYTREEIAYIKDFILKHLKTNSYSDIRVEPQ